jgi:hypothetical protein
MKTWTHATISEPCGRCGRAIAEGQPELRYQFTEVHRALIRCVACAGERVPDDLAPPRPLEIGVIGGGERSDRSIHAAPDYKARQSGDAD